MIEEQTVPWLRSEVYNRTAEFERSSGPLWVQWTVDPSGVVLGLLVKPAPTPAASEFTGRQTETPFRLPFEGEWFVTWGGRSVLDNYHAVASDQRFAYDFLVVRDGQTHVGDPAQNESYFCFGRPVLAPGGGVVVDAADGVADNVPGQLNAEQPLGNHVVIDHGSGEFSFLVHLQRGSVAVEPGQRVEPGEPLGQCGNSGHSSEPHLHYHLQDTPEYQRGAALPAQFIGYRANGSLVNRGEPTRGQTISQ
ncbi:M23 family metallopeptidase [Rubrivirga sp.]|uniref:M23 family metallopeptidase n=1 Tax=Rubrivirga sp. TaxID=1885344 RepID=UPI003B518F02